VNPWLLLAAVVAWMASIWMAYETGGDHREDAIVAKAKKDQDDAIEKHRKESHQDMGDAIAYEQKVAKRMAEALKQRHTLELDILRRGSHAKPIACTDAANKPVPVPSCDLDDKSFGLLLGAVRRANAAVPAAATGVPAPVPADPGAGRRERGDSAPVDR